MNLSVIIPTYRRPQDLGRCLQALTGQTRPADEVLVVVRDGDEDTRRLLAGPGPAPLPLKVVRVAAPGVVAAMTAGLAAAQGDVIALTDDDTVPHPDWLERIAAHFAADGRVGGVGGRDWQVNERGERPVVGKVQWHGRVIGNHHLGAGGPRDVDLLKGANCAYRARPLREIGFETRLRGAGAQAHWELCLGLAMRRAGWRLVYDPAVALDHFPARRFDDDLLTRAGGVFSASALHNAAYNETLALWTHLPPPRRAAFLAWAVLVGTAANPGLLQTARLRLLRRSHVTGRLRATITGRCAGVWTASSGGLPESRRPALPPPCRVDEAGA